jgi:glyoxylase I family protein
MEKVTGIGGFFFRANDHKGLAAWYERHLGINPVPQGPEGEPWRQEAGPTAFSPFKADSQYFGDPARHWMLNFRVRDIEAMIAQLRRAGIEVKDAETYDGIGRFTRLVDPEGNPIELWEPVRE